MTVAAGETHPNLSAKFFSTAACKSGMYEETARESSKRGYRTTIISDAVSSYMPDLHAAVLKNFALKFGWVSPAATVIDELRQRRGAVS